MSKQSCFKAMLANDVYFIFDALLNVNDDNDDDKGDEDDDNET